MRRLLRTLLVPANLAGLVLVALAGTALARIDLFEWLYEVSRSYEGWSLDELFSGLIAVALAVPILLVRWNRALARAHKETSEAEAEAQHVGLHDPLTGLPNRRCFHLRMEEATGTGSLNTRNEGPILLLLDLDRFKPVNDLRGHQAGDLLLCATAARLRRICPEDALIVRLGGDEFAVVLRAWDCPDHGGSLARRIVQALSEPFEFDDWSATISCSIGIAVWSDGMMSSELLRRADQAMYRAKQAGRGGYTHYDEAFGAALREQAALEQDLRRALLQGAIIPYFQPIYDITGRGLRGFEVLARWSHPERGFIPPDVFVALAEEIGLIEQLSDVVLDKACSALAGWRTDLPMSFNLSPRQFADLGLPHRILGILERHGIPGYRLEIEITERAVLADLDIARRIIGDLADAGVRISLDDFGTGTSSLALLTQLPIDKLKIDRSFIHEVDLLPHKAKIVSGVLALADSLGLDVTAEGIERDEELAFLARENCALGQGYLLGRPQPAPSIAELIEASADQAIGASLTRVAW